MPRTAFTVLTVFFVLFSVVAEAKKQRLTDDPLYGVTTTSPREFLGYPLDAHILRHDQVNYYLKEIAQQNPRVSLEHTGVSHEGRQQLTAVISSAHNQQQLTNILKQRQQVKYSGTQTGPLIIWLAYSIHGDEASGTHAALKLSHMLATSQEKWVTQLLEQAIVLITPSQNPDGMDRFSTWANGYAGKVAVNDPNHKEHKQGWPSGRSNHYFADLNRDWLFLRHPESQGRVALFHRWQPHYVGDFHEMDHQLTYFFQPGVPERTHPLTSTENQTLTAKLATYHQAALDSKQQPYFRGQLFDDFFYGKGSTYPDINGAIGVLFEQGSSRGQQQASDNGVVHFKTAIDNQYSTSISSLKGALALKHELQDYQADFFKGKYQKPGKKKSRQAGRLISTVGDNQRIKQLVSLLSQHKIDYYYITHPLSQGGRDFAVHSSIFVPEQQAQSSLLAALFDERTEFNDPTFYDVSSWDLQHALNLTVRKNVKLELSVLSKKAPTFQPQAFPAGSVALLIDWRQSQAAPALQQLLSQGIQVKFAAKGFTIGNQKQQINFPAGTLQIPLQQDGHSAAELKQTLSALSQKMQLKVTAAQSSGSLNGIDLGSPDFHVIQPIKPLIVSGTGTSVPEVGQIWYYLDSQLKVPTSLVDIDNLNAIELNHYSHIIFAGGSYRTLDDKFARKLDAFTANGGTVIAQKDALVWLDKANFLKTNLRGSRFYKQLFNAKGLPFDQKASFNAKQQIGGAIVELTLDKSHPMSFGITGEHLSVMKNKVLGFARTTDNFSQVASYSSQPLLSGYLAQEYQSSFANTPAIMVESRGEGAVVALIDNLLFRNIWLGSQQLYANALYFVPALH